MRLLGVGREQFGLRPSLAPNLPILIDIVIASFARTELIKWVANAARLGEACQ